MPTLTKTALNQLLEQGCSDPGCKQYHEPLEEIYLHPRCHPSSPVWASYNKGGNVVLECAECRKPVVVIPLCPEDE